MLQVFRHTIPLEISLRFFLKIRNCRLKFAYMKFEVRGTTANVNPQQSLIRVAY